MGTETLDTRPSEQVDTTDGRSERRLLVVSNRLPFTAVETAEGLILERSSGGLVTALDPVLRRHGGTWVGWAGEADAEALVDGVDVPYRIVPVELNREEARAYYEGFANGTLWPLLHSLADRMRFDRDEWAAYERVNERFAQAVHESLVDSELVWFHDYHFMRAPLYLRRLRPDARIAYFHHVPFPGPDVLRLLPCDRQLLRGLLACDVVGFQVPSYASNFADCAKRLLGARHDQAGGFVEYAGRSVRIGAFPLGIDFDRWERLARAASSDALLEGGKRVLLGVDRLDYTKGIPERIAAFERLLETHPELLGEVVLLQLAVPSRASVAEYEALKRRIDEMVGRVNGHFATANWTPVRYLYRSVSPETLSALYRDADVALVTPLRDGMNLVAKEFVACQVAYPGVLVLSSLAGASETMREAELVNPYDLEGLAEAMHRALIMPEEDRRSRLLALRRREREHDVHDWLQHSLRAAYAPPHEVAAIGSGDFEQLFGDYLDRYRVTLLLDYDGTLSPIAKHPREAVLLPRTRAALEACLARPDVDVAVVSGRSLADVRAAVGLDGVIYAGNHGLEIEGVGIKPFRHPDLGHFEEKSVVLALALQEVATDGAWVEPKGATLTFHYREAPEGLRHEMAARAREIIVNAGFQARDAILAVEARPPIAWDKGEASLHVLRAIHGRDWAESVRVVYAGDDLTDEDAFRRLASLALTFRVGPFEQPTAADHQLVNPEALTDFLEWIATRRKPAS